MFSLRRRRNHSDYRQIFLDFNQALHIIKDKEMLISSICTRICELISTNEIHFFWINHESTRYNFLNASTKDEQLYFSSDDGLIQWLNLNEKPLLVSFKPEYINIYSDNDLTVIKKLNCHLIFPLKVSNQCKGVILLGERKNNRKYTNYDIEILSILLDNAALAIENSLYNEERSARLKYMIHTDRLAVIGQLAAGAAHEIRNPLTSIRSAIQYIQKDISDVKKQSIIKSLLSEVDRINDIVSGLLSFSRQNDPVKKVFDLSVMIEQTLLLIQNTRLKKQITFNFHYLATHTSITADSDQLKQVLMNILLNSVDAIEEEGKIDISVKEAKEKKDFYNIIITDNGKGITPENMENLFTPFFTTKEEGTGLGLSISYGIIQRHRGSIEVTSELHKGTQIIIFLPVNG